ncbi:putative basic proline-rich protein-like [Iris pallida]|uniref:Basic proline-rich protein-like n=1 Tax=Iris pallida TaxID=29817 RepID=A0AAX6EP98_IRIPA|nr:putative basic proline-rich protein-like [Iris pallida]KAJ6828572.1 putative basic proline-rich protein-like [Iris pallida]
MRVGKCIPNQAESLRGIMMEEGMYLLFGIKIWKIVGEQQMVIHGRVPFTCTRQSG